MMRHAALALNVLVLLASPALARADDTQRLALAASREPLAAAEQALRAKLAATYPAIERWQIEPLLLGPGAEGVPEAPPSGSVPADAPAEAAPRVVRMGARSAVWLPAAGAGPRHGKLVWFVVAGFGRALVATHDVPARARFGPGDASVAERDWLSLDCEPLRDAAALTDERAKHALRSGEVVCPNLLERVPEVSRGQEVIVRYSGHSFVLTARGISQADAGLGAAVLVRNSSSGEMLTGTVSGTGEVQVNE